MKLTDNGTHHNGVEAGQGHCIFRGFLLFHSSCSSFWQSKSLGGIQSLSSLSFQRVMSNSAFLKMATLDFGRKEKLPL